MRTLNNKFDSFVCVGDAISWDVGAFTLTATVHHDEDSHPTDFECYSAGDVERWENEEWSYVGIVIDVSIRDVPITKHAASVWGVECNFDKDNTHLDEVAFYLEGEALEQAHVDLVRIRKALESADTNQGETK